MAYITKTYLESFFSADQIDSLLSYGNVTTPVSQSVQNEKVDIYISGSCAMIDSFLQQSGYEVPLTTVPASIQKVACYLTIQDLFAQANQPIPQAFQKQIDDQYAYLNMLKNKQLQIPGLIQNPDTGIGGNMFNFDSNGNSTNDGCGGTHANCVPKRFWSVKKLYGSYF